MSAYKLYYFDIKGPGETIRWLLAYGGVDFEDKRVTEDEWKLLKPTMPFNQMPVLEIDGTMYNQSSAICRYLAKQFGLAGGDDLENLAIDSAVDCITDLYSRVIIAWYEIIPEAKTQRKQIAEETVDLFIDSLENMAKVNGGYLVGGRLTWTDIKLLSSIESISFRIGRSDVIERAEYLKALRKKVQALPSIKALLEKRPKTNY